MRELGAREGEVVQASAALARSPGRYRYSHALPPAPPCTSVLSYRRKAHIKRIVKAKLAELTAGEGDQKREVSVQKEALSAFAESARIFIHFLTATANEVCHENKRLTINAEDVLKAIEEVEFHDFVEPLREALAAFKAANAEKAAAKKTEKRKADGDADAGAEGAAEDAEAVKPESEHAEAAALSLPDDALGEDEEAGQ